MSTVSLVRAIGVLFFLLATLPAQVLDHSIPLDDGDSGTPDTGFGVTMSPDGVHAYATIAGDLFGINNDDVARIDVIAGTQVGIAQAQLYPEDSAVTLDALGAARHVYVANSTTGSVSCFTPALGFVANIPLSLCLGSSYPFGVLASPDQSRVYVSTIGFGCNGRVDVIDSDPASAGFNTVLTSFFVPNAGGRMNWWTYPLLVIPTTIYDANFTLSQGGFAVVDVSNTASQSSYVISQAIPNHFASTTECVVIPGDKVLLSIGNEVFPTVYECSLSTGAILRTLDLNTIAGIILHGLTTSPDKTLGVITSLNGGETVFFDLATFTVAGVHSHGSTAKPNDVVFTPDGSRAVVSCQGDARVDVLKQIPGYALTLAAPPTVAVGNNLLYSVARCESAQPWGLYYSIAGAGPQQVGPYTIYLSNPFDLAHLGVGGLQGLDSVTFVVPSLPGLPGTTVSTQAVTVDRDGGIRLSNGAQTLIQ